MYYKIIQTKEDKYKVTIDEKDKICPVCILDLHTNMVLDLTEKDALGIANTIIDYYNANKIV